MDQSKQVRVFERHGENRRFIRTLFLDEWLRYTIGRFPTHEIEQIHNDLTILGRATAQGSLGQRFEYELV